jgi:hypothetical protein
MPKARGGQGTLTPAMLRWLATGDTAGSSAEDGHLDAFLLAGRVHGYLLHPRTWAVHRAAVDEVRALYGAHRDEIDAAARVATAGKFRAYAAAILAKADELARADEE